MASPSPRGRGWSAAPWFSHPSPGQLDPCTCNPSHLFRIGRPKAKLILCLIPNLPSPPHFHPLSHVKTFRDSWIKISGTVQHPSHPGGTPHQHHSPSPGPLPSQAGVLGQLPWVLDSKPPPRSCQTNSLQLTFHPGTALLKILPWLLSNGCLKSKHICLAQGTPPLT